MLRKKCPTTIGNLEPRNQREQLLVDAIKRRRTAIDEVVRVLHRTMRENRSKAS